MTRPVLPRTTFRAIAPALACLAVVTVGALGAGPGAPAAAATSTSGATAAADTRTSLRPAGKYAPAGGVLLGGYVNTAGHWVDSAFEIKDVAAREKLVGHRMDINQHYYGWSDPFPGAVEADDAAKGRIPLISWSGTTLSSITNGSQNAIVDARIAAIKAFAKPVLLRWNWEMNGDWNAGGGPANNDPGTTNGPAKYVAAWKYLHDRFAAKGVTNVAWVWCPNATGVPSSTWNHWTAYYPGDAYVDWVATDTYNWGTLRSTSTWHSMAATAAPIYADYATKKPFMLAEYASTEVGGDKAAWIAQVRSDIKTMFPALAAAVWFDEDKETAWDVASSPTSLAAYQAMAADPYFKTATTPVPAPMPPALTPTDNPPVAGRVAGPLVQPGGALLGLDITAPAGSTVQTVMADRERRAQRAVDVDNHDYRWTDATPGILERWDLQNGRIPMVTWYPDGLRLSGLAAGSNDARVKLMAQALKGLPGKVFLRFAPGMNGPATVTWSGLANSDPGTSNGTTKFVAAWKHVKDVFAAQGVTNVVWVWAPDAADAPGSPSWNHWPAYYPGDTYLDWVGMSAVNYGSTRTGSTWTTTTALFGRLYTDYATRKPIMVAETASVESGGSKSGWICGAGAALKSSFPDVAAWVYADTAGTELALTSSASAYDAWVTTALDPYFRETH